MKISNIKEKRLLLLLQRYISNSNIYDLLIDDDILKFNYTGESYLVMYDTHLFKIINDNYIPYSIGKWNGKNEMKICYDINNLLKLLKNEN